MKEVLRISALRTYFYTKDGVIKAVDGISLKVDAAGVLGVVGESGCGKTVTALSILKLLPEPPARIVSGKIIFEGRDIIPLRESEMRRIRGDRISMVFQEPMTSLNPVFTIGEQIAEVLRAHKKLGRREARDRSIELLRMVGIPSPEQRIKDYPHQLSGGMRQRVMIAMAMSCKPSLIIADEPTTALDVTIQAQILELLKRLREEIGMTLILITHDLGVISEIAGDVVVMYTGRIVEQASTRDLLLSPLHPYTEGLLRCLPSFDNNGRKKRLQAIPGMVPRLSDLPKGCRFSPRCPLVIEQCREEEPELKSVSGSNRLNRCWVRNP